MGRSVIYRGIILEKEIEKNVYMSVPRNYCAAASITNRFLIVYRISWRVLLTYYLLRINVDADEPSETNRIKISGDLKKYKIKMDEKDVHFLPTLHR